MIREFGYKRLIKLVPADLFYPKLTVFALKDAFLILAMFAKCLVSQPISFWSFNVFHA